MQLERLHVVRTEINKHFDFFGTKKRAKLRVFCLCGALYVEWLIMKVFTARNRF